MTDTDDEILEMTFPDPQAPQIKKEQEVRLNKIGMYTKHTPHTRVYDNRTVRHAFKIPTHTVAFRYPEYQNEMTHLYNFGQQLLTYMSQEGRAH